MTLETTTTPETETTTNPSTEKLVRDLFGVGALWATHGLTIARSSLEAGSETLKRTASLLGGIADSIDERSKQPRLVGAPASASAGRASWRGRESRPNGVGEGEPRCPEPHATLTARRRSWGVLCSQSSPSWRSPARSCSSGPA